MKDFDALRQELNEYRRSRHADISGGNLVTGKDMRSLLSNIKSRVLTGEKRRKLVKDELLRFWKKKGTKMRRKLLSKMSETAHPNLYPIVLEVDNEVKQSEWWKYDKDDVMSAYYWARGTLPPQDHRKYNQSWEVLKLHLEKKYPPPRTESVQKKK
jgi:hypothetical protein